MLGILHSICSIGIDLQQHVIAKGVAHRTNGLDVTAGFDL